ncbi:MAG: hypothetical protein IJY87_04070 [Bacilli bacterium]|nr:hypothetical protein [Bacilli bacterium]MBQ8902228.1 hypothetical protein [Bacilli bacterium]
MNVIVSNKYQTLLGTLNIDVIKTINGEFSVQDLVNQFGNFFYNKMIIDITAIKNYENVNVMRELSMNFEMDKIIILLDDSPQVNSSMYLSQLVSVGIYNFTRSVDAVPFLLDHPNAYKDVAAYQNLNTSFDMGNKMNVMKEDNQPVKIEQRVIGFKNVTEHAGATTLIYMLKKHLQDAYKVKALEINNTDFEYFNDKTLESADFMNASFIIANNSDAEVILVDLNDGPESICTEIIYLIEPGIIKLNKLIRTDRKIFDKLRNKKIVLNKSVLNSSDVSDFEYESGSRVFFNIPCLDEKLDNNKKITEFLIALGFSRLNTETKKW